MKISKQRLRQIVREEIQNLNEGLKRFKVYVSGEKEPLILLGKNEKDVKQIAYTMIKNSSVKIRKVVKEGKLTEATDSYVVWSPLLNKVYDGPVSEKKALMLIKKYAKQGQYHVGMLGTKYFNKTKLGKKNPVKEEKLKESWDSPQAYSSPEAGKIIDGAIRNYAKELRKVQYNVVKDWMSKAKSGVIDYFDIVRGLQTGDVTKAHPYETQFLNKVLNKDKIIQRFRQYFGGKKGKRSRRK